MPVPRRHLPATLLTTVLLLTAPLTGVLDLVRLDAAVARVVLPGPAGELEAARTRQAARAAAGQPPDTVLAGAIAAGEGALARYRPQGVALVLAWVVVRLAGAALALLLLWRSAARADVRALAFFLGLVFGYDLLPALGIRSFVPAVLVAPLVVAALVRFAAVFPRPLDPALLERPAAEGRRRRFARARRGWRWLERAMLRPRVLVVYTMVPAAAFLLVWVAGESFLAARRLEWPPWLILPLALLVLGLLCLMLLALAALALGGALALRYLWVGFRAAGAAERPRLLWLVVGVFAYVCGLAVAGLAGSLLGASAGPPFGPFIGTLATGAGELLATVLLLACLALAVLRHDAFDSGLALRRTTLYGALSVVLVVLFAGVEQLASGVLTRRLGLPDALGGWIAGATVALAFGPLHAGLKQATTRLYRRLLPASVPSPAPLTPAG